MVSLTRALVAVADGGLSGSAVRGVVDAAAQPPAVDAARQAAQAVGTVAPSGLEHTVATAAEQLLQGLDLAEQASQAAAHTAETTAASMAGAASSLGSSFTWGGYIQAVGLLFLLVAVLCLVVWLVRRFGKFNFLPRPGSLPRNALAMEAQLPLGPRKGLMVVRFLNRRLLLGVTDQQITLLTEEQAEHEPGNADFTQIMEDARRGAGNR